MVARRSSRAEVDPGAAPGLIRREGRWLLALLVLAFAARVPWLGRADLWGDEILFVQIASPPLTPLQVIHNFWVQFLAIGHLPFFATVHNLLIWPLMSLAADLSHAAGLQRLPAALVGSLQVPLLYLLARQVSTRTVAVLAALFMGFTSFPIYFSRESYFYAGLTWLFTASALVYIRIVQDGRCGRGRGWLLWALLSAASLTHVNGSTMGLAALVTALLGLMITRQPVYGRLAGISLAGALAASPFFLQRLGRDSGVVFPLQPGMFDTLLDFSGKTWLGTSMWSVGLAWLLFAAGVWAVFRRSEGRPARLALFSLFLIPFLIIWYATQKTQYFARYLSGPIGLYYILLAMGLENLLRRLGGRAPRAAIAFAVLLVLPHWLFFIPQIYRLPAKGVHYGGIAQWLNKNLSPGTPYVMESAYELRFTSGFYPTPNLVPAAPYVHGSAPGELERLRARQMDFMNEYPEAPFIESARHGSEIGSAHTIWTWPHTNFAHRVDIVNEPMRKLSAWGIWPQAPLTNTSIIQYETRIYYNQPEDVVDRLRQRGEALRLQYPEWSVVAIQQGEYARMRQDRQGAVEVSNVTDRAVRGRFALEGAIAGPARSFDVLVNWQDQLIARTNRMGGQLWGLETAPLELPPGGAGRLMWGIPPSQTAGLQGLLIRHIRFVPDTEGAAP